MSSGRKKVIVRKLSRDWLAGYMPASGFTRGNCVEMLDLAGKVVEMEMANLKWVCFVRDFNSGEVNNPERLLRRNFTSRPRGEGLYLRVRLKDGEILEGLTGNDLSLVASDGIFLTPPDLRSNTQRVWIPRSGLDELEVVAVLNPARRRIATSEISAPAEQLQEKLF